MISFGGKKCVLWLRGVIHDQDVVVVDCDVCQCFVFLFMKRNKSNGKLIERKALKIEAGCSILPNIESWSISRGLGITLVAY